LVRLVTKLIKLSVKRWQVSRLSNKPTATNAVFRAMRYAAIDAINGLALASLINSPPFQRLAQRTDFIGFYGVASDKHKPAEHSSSRWIYG
jgi:hypothetical protein